MRFDPPLSPGRLLKRYKRFLAEVVLDDGSVVVAHCANSGSMLGLAQPGSRIWLSRNTNPRAKLEWRWELVDDDGVWVGINTSRPNALVAQAIAEGALPELAGYATLRREVPYGRGSRIDILLQGPERPLAYVEVKSVTLRRREVGTQDADLDAAAFPDAVTVRGAKHLGELAAVARAGGRAVMLYLAQRSDCRRFRLAADLDPAYAAAFRSARAAGVEALCYDCTLSPQEIRIRGSLPVIEPPAALGL